MLFKLLVLEFPFISGDILPCSTHNDSPNYILSEERICRISGKKSHLVVLSFSESGVPLQASLSESVGIIHINISPRLAQNVLVELCLES